MADIVVLASGNGSNFQAIADYFAKTGKHRVAALLSDQNEAFALKRAKNLAIPLYVIPYYKGLKARTEAIYRFIIDSFNPRLIVLAGFMRILSPAFASAYSGRIVNIHPSLLPAYPGTHSIERAFAAGEPVLGITIHYVDAGVDTGPIILQKSVPREETLETMTEAIHQLEHDWYPKKIYELLETMDPPSQKPN